MMLFLWSLDVHSPSLFPSIIQRTSTGGHWCCVEFQTIVYRLSFDSHQIFLWLSIGFVFDPPFQFRIGVPWDIPCIWIRLYLDVHLCFLNVAGQIPESKLWLTQLSIVEQLTNNSMTRGKSNDGISRDIYAKSLENREAIIWKVMGINENRMHIEGRSTGKPMNTRGQSKDHLMNIDERRCEITWNWHEHRMTI